MSDTETMVKVMSAYVDGGMIEYRNKMFGGDWTPITKTVPLWNWPHYEYRIKPEDAEHVNIGTDKRLWALEQQVNNLQLALREVRLNQNSKWTGTKPEVKKPELSLGEKVSTLEAEVFALKSALREISINQQSQWTGTRP